MLGVLVIVLSILLAACGGNPPSRGGSGSHVEVVGSGFVLNGRPWWPIGLDAYELGTNWSINKGCGAQVDLDSYFGSLPPHSVTRFDLFETQALNKDTHLVDFRALDAVFAAAGRHDQLLVAVLSSGEGACEGDVFKDRRWYAGGWKTPSGGLPLSYASWLDTAVRRWRSSPALAGWELVGEPEPSVCTAEDCDWHLRACPPDAAQVLRSFFDAAGQRVKALDRETPIWEGLAGGGQCGAKGDEYAFVGQSPAIDVLDVHDYGPVGVPLPGPGQDGMQQRIDQARALGKPLVAAEIGQLAGSCRSLSDRAVDLAHTVSVQRAAGTAGALFWAFVPDPSVGECTFDVGPGDPLLGVLSSAAR